jgi:phage shock protein C
MEEKKLYRSVKNRMLGGVCGGLGEFFGIDPTIIRLLWAFATIFFGVNILIYLVGWIIIPEE